MAPDILKESYALVITGYADFLLGLLDPEDGALYLEKCQESLTQ